MRRTYLINGCLSLVIVLALLAGSVAAQVSSGVELWTVAEIYIDTEGTYDEHPLEVLSLPSDSFSRTNEVEHSIPKNQFVYLVFNLPTGRTEHLYLYLSKGIHDCDLFNVDGRQLKTGYERKLPELSWPLSHQVFEIPPSWNGRLILRLKDYKYKFHENKSNVFRLSFYGSEFQDVWKEELDTSRWRDQKKGNLIFLLLFGAMLLIATVFLLIVRHRVFGMYLLYNGITFTYYFTRKATLFNSQWAFSGYEKTAVEAIGAVLIYLSYLYFLREYLRLGNNELDRRIGRFISKLAKGSWALLLLIGFLCAFVSVSWGYRFSVVGLVVFLSISLFMLKLVYRRGDTLSRLICIAAGTLIMGISIILLRRYFPDRIGKRFISEESPFWMSWFQLAVLIESGILLVGLRTFWKMITEEAEHHRLLLKTTQIQLVQTEERFVRSEEELRVKQAELEQRLLKNDAQEEANNHLVFIRFNDHRSKRLNEETVVYLRSSQRCCIAIHAETGREEVFETGINDMERQLMDHPAFLRIHNRVIINEQYVDRYELGRRKVHLHGKEEPLTIGKTYVKSLKNRLSERG